MTEPGGEGGLDAVGLLLVAEAQLEHRTSGELHESLVELLGHEVVLVVARVAEADDGDAQLGEVGRRHAATHDGAPEGGHVVGHVALARCRADEDHQALLLLLVVVVEKSRRETIERAELGLDAAAAVVATHDDCLGLAPNTLGKVLSVARLAAVHDEKLSYLLGGCCHVAALVRSIKQNLK